MGCCRCVLRRSVAASRIVIMGCGVISSAVIVVGRGSAQETVRETTLAVADRTPHFVSAPSPVTGLREDMSALPLLRRRVSLALSGVSLEAALIETARQAHLELTYSRGVAPLDHPVSIRADDITLAAALTEILLGTDVDVQLSSSGRAALVRRVAPSGLRARQQAGAVSGRVTDAKTARPIAQATVAIEGTSLGATTEFDGRYRIAGVAPGSYHVRARRLGYTASALAAVVADAGAATVNFALAPSAAVLDQVVTTGTVTPTAVKALPTPISVVTGDQIEQKGYQRVDQIFRGDIPGAFAWDNGAINYYSAIHIRGISTLYVSNNVKTYIDGVEVADPAYLATIDPASIARIEVLRGPQGSTLYGSQALAGVMQIFTKNGEFNTPGPVIEATASAGSIQSRWSNAVQQDYSLAANGGSNDFAYRIGAGYQHNGDWLPEANSTNASLYGSLRASQGPVTVTLSGRYYDKSMCNAVSPALQNYLFYSKPFHFTDVVQQQTYGLTFNYAANVHWQHTVVLGYDRTDFQQYQHQPRFTTPADSFLTVYTNGEAKPSIAYNTTYTVSLGRAAQSALTAGADHYAYYGDGFYAGNATVNSNTIPSPFFGTRSQYNNTGYFAQEQLSFWDAAFVTAGLRAEENSNFGSNYGLFWAPRIGVSYVHGLGDVTFKARAAYGTAIRPPDPGLAQAVVTAAARQLANPQLGPEKQQGWDGGLELYVNRWGSVEGTYYNQRATDLIDQVALGVISSIYTFQNENVGLVDNKGWEFQARLTPGPLSVTGTYSITTSVVRRLSSTYTGDLRPGDAILGIPTHTAGATVSYGLPHTALTVGMTHIGSWVQSDVIALFGYYFGGQPYRGSGRDYWITYPGFFKFNASISQSITDRLSVFLRADNVTNNNVAEANNFAPIAGRVTMVGVRTKF